jgi:hypothetical protein
MPVHHKLGYISLLALTVDMAVIRMAWPMVQTKS